MRIFIATALSAALFLTGCASDAEAPDTTGLPTASASPSQTVDEKFVEDLSDNVEAFDGGDPTKIVAAGEGVCSYFMEHGVSLGTFGILYEEFQRGGTFTDEEIAEIFVISTDAYCPEIKEAILNLSSESS